MNRLRQLRGRLGGHASAAARFRGRASYHRSRGELDLAREWDEKAEEHEREAAGLTQTIQEILRDGGEYS